jgi:hypothetical protein
MACEPTEADWAEAAARIERARAERAERAAATPAIAARAAERVPVEVHHEMKPALRQSR